MADVVDEETKVVESLTRACYGQIRTGVVIMVVWLCRMLSCSQLRYLTDRDIGIALWVMLNALVLSLVVKVTKIVNADINANKHALVMLPLCIVNVGLLLMYIFTGWQAAIIVQHLTRLIFCETYAFGNTGHVVTQGNFSSEMGKSSFDCPWSMMDRENVTGGYFCPFDNGSVAEGHWKRKLGLANYRITILVTAYCAVVVLMMSFLLIRFVFAVCAGIAKGRANDVANTGSSESRPVAVAVHDPPPPYTSRQQNRDNT